MARTFKLIENYIYLYHTGVFILIPTYPESVSDSMSANFSPTTPLARTAPIQSYTGSGPRTVRVKLDLHRDLMTQINTKASNALINIYKSLGMIDQNATSSSLPENFADDYVDILIKNIQAIAYPTYSDAARQVDPPQIALRFGNDIFIKGVVNGSVSVEYSGPILSNDKYAMVGISFDVTEIDPQSAQTVSLLGSFRGDSSKLDNQFYNGISSVTRV